MYHAYACIPANHTYDIELAKYRGNSSENVNEKVSIKRQGYINLSKNAATRSIANTMWTFIGILKIRFS